MTPRRGLGSYWSMFKDGYEELVNAIVRPPRAQYTLQELGPTSFEYGNTAFVREDFKVTNPRGLQLECSFWHRRDLPEGGHPCVVYMHGNASCRAEAVCPLAAQSAAVATPREEIASSVCHSLAAHACLASLPPLAASAWAI